MLNHSKNLTMSADISEEKLMSITFLNYFDRIRTGYLKFFTFFPFFPSLSFLPSVSSEEVLSHMVEK